MYRLGFFVLFCCVVLNVTNAENRATVVLKNSDGVFGHLILTQTNEGVHIQGQVSGLAPGKHGFHVHALGDVSNGCTTTGAHYNPTNSTHGAPTAEVRHAGDLGNIEADETGVAHVNITDKMISLGGKHSILGRAIVIHTGEDDMGLGGHLDSNTTGHAGGRVTCGIIGILSPEEWAMGAANNFGTSLSLLFTVIPLFAAVILG